VLKFLQSSGLKPMRTSLHLLQTRWKVFQKTHNGEPADFNAMHPCPKACTRKPLDKWPPSFLKYCLVGPQPALSSCDGRADLRPDNLAGDYQFHAAILLPAACRFVGGHRLSLAEAPGTD